MALCERCGREAAATETMFIRDGKTICRKCHSPISKSISWLRDPKRRLAVTATVCLLIGAMIGVGFSMWHNRPHYASLQAAEAAHVQFVASAGRAPFHTLTCRYAKKIAAGNLEGFATREEAIAAGHVPCKVCHP